VNDLLIEDQPPVDPLPSSRTCGNCGCAARMNRKGEFSDVAAVSADSFLICRRNMPQASEARTRQPRIDPRTGKPAENGQGQKLFEEVAALQIGYPATLPEATCFDGWRPLGTLPGVRWETQRMTAAFVPMLEKALIQTGISHKQAHALGEAMRTGLLPQRS
jgi:hypothetical protein